MTSTGVRVPAIARIDGGSTFCTHGTVVQAQEAVVTDGQRILTPNGR